MSNSLPADMLTATDQIYLSLWNQICSLDLLPGEKLSEVRLAAEFECSRVPVREALHRLAADGAVDVFPKRGSFVSLIDRQQVEQTRYLREGNPCLSGSVRFRRPYCDLSLSVLHCGTAADRPRNG